MDIPQWSEATSSKEEDIKCISKSHVETVKEEVKGSSIKEGKIRIRKCRRRGRVENMNRQVKRWKSSLKQQKYPPEPTITK